MGSAVGGWWNRLFIWMYRNNANIVQWKNDNDKPDDCKFDPHS